MKRLSIIVAILSIAQAQGTSYNFASAIYRSGKAVGTALAFAPTAVQGYALAREEYYEKKHNKNQKFIDSLPAMSPTVEQWGKERAQECNMPPVRIAPWQLYDSPLRTAGGVIGIHNDVLPLIEGTKERVDFSLSGVVTVPLSQKSLPVIMRHELGHIYHKHNEFQTVAAGGIAVAALHAVSMVKKATPPTTVWRALAKSSILALSGLVKGSIVPAVAIPAYSRYREASADKFAAQHTTNPQELRAMAEVFDAQEQAEKKTLSQAPFYASALTRCFREHPSGAERAQFFRQEAEKLEVHEKC